MATMTRVREKPPISPGDKIALDFELVQYDETPADPPEGYEPDMRPVFRVVQPGGEKVLGVVRRSGGGFVTLDVERLVAEAVMSGPREVFDDDGNTEVFVEEIEPPVIDRRTILLPIAAALPGLVRAAEPATAEVEKE